MAAAEEWLHQTAAACPVTAHETPAMDGGETVSTERLPERHPITQWEGGRGQSCRTGQINRDKLRNAVDESGLLGRLKDVLRPMSSALGQLAASGCLVTHTKV